MLYPYNRAFRYYAGYPEPELENLDKFKLIKLPLGFHEWVKA